jgi:DNA primase
VDAASQSCPHQTVRTLVTELAVEPLHHRSEPDARYMSSLIAALQEGVVAAQIAELKSRLQRLSPVEDEEDYRALFGDLVALEQYRKALGDQAAGGFS